MEGLEEDLHKVQMQGDSSKREAEDVLRQLQDEQRRTASLTQEISSSASSRLALQQAQEKVSDLTNDNVILREANEKLLSSAFDIEKERKFMAVENALKVQISQLETTLKSDLNDKSRLTDALANERENYSQLESDFNDLQSKFLKMKEEIENQEDKLQYFSKENDIDQRELEQALMYIKQKNDTILTPIQKPSTFVDQINGNNVDEDARKELSELQIHFIEATNEIEKMRNLLRVQVNINNEQKKEIAILKKRLGSTQQDFQDQLSEYHKLMEIRAAKIKKLESQLRDTAMGGVQKNFVSNHEEMGQMHGVNTTVSTSSGQSLFEIHVQRVTLSHDLLLVVGIPEPKFFVSWLFYDSDQSYTPVLQGPVAVFDSSSYYKIQLDDTFMEFLTNHEVIFQVHIAVNNECQTVAASAVKFSEILDYPQNKLHGKINLLGVKGSSKDHQVGVMDYWFKLHTHDIGKIRGFVERRDNTERSPRVPILFERNQSFLQGEKKKLMRNKKVQESPREDETSPPPAPKANKTKSKEKMSKKEPMEKPIPAARKPGHIDKFPTKDRPKPPRLSKVKIEVEDTDSQESSSGPSRVHTTLSKDCVAGLDNIIKEREDKNKKSEAKKLNESKNDESNRDNTDQAKDTETSAQQESIAEKPLDSKKKRSILKSLSAAKHVKSDESSLLVSEEGEKKSKEIVETREETPAKKPLEVKGMDKLTTSKESTETSSVSKDEVGGKSPSSIEQKTIEEESEDEDETETEDDDDTEEESETESDETDEDSEEDDDDDITTTEATTRADTSAATSTYEVNPPKVIVVPDLHEQEVSQESNDSEGVVTKKSPIKKVSCLPTKDTIIILVSDFEAAQDAPFVTNDQVSLLYVEYTFLDVPQEDLETPFSLPKPGSLEKITFNFRKVFTVDRTESSPRRRLVSKMLNSEQDSARLLRFTLVSEPPDSEPDLDCEDIGVADLDLGIIDRSGQDLVDQRLEVKALDSPDTVLGTLTVSVEAAQAFKSIRA